VQHHAWPIAVRKKQLLQMLADAANFNCLLLHRLVLDVGHDSALPVPRLLTWRARLHGQLPMPEEKPAG
jgi:hypothetical protein